MRVKILLLLVAALLTACSEKTIQDHDTKLELSRITDTENLLVFEHRYDNMDRGNHNLEGELAADPDYYKSNPVRRGDIIYYSNPHSEQWKNHNAEEGISRVIALPGERIYIKQGQIYIDDRKLDTFYGEARRLGSTRQELQESLKQDDLDENIRRNLSNTVQSFLGEQLEELSVPDGHYYIIGDDWIRSGDSRHYGPLPESSIIGKVIGHRQWPGE